MPLPGGTRECRWCKQETGVAALREPGNGARLTLARREAAHRVRLTEWSACITTTLERAHLAPEVLSNRDEGDTYVVVLQPTRFGKSGSAYRAAPRKPTSLTKGDLRAPRPAGSASPKRVLGECSRVWSDFPEEGNDRLCLEMATVGVISWQPGHFLSGPNSSVTFWTHSGCIRLARLIARDHHGAAGARQSARAAHANHRLQRAATL
ncbi:hypothetical protein MRX96_010384 [Rhipicephalus microplus]